VIAQRPPLAQIWEWLGAVPDPEIPAVSVVDLGIVRDVAWIDGAGAGVLKVTVTPTYSGCPATRVIARDIVLALRDRGVEHVELEVRVAPPWTTDWLSESGREKLQAYGIAPPAGDAIRMLDITGFVAPLIVCPRCASEHVELVSRFGSTPCKALYRCNACREPFDHFKCH
jgi:ring-1,2-phenylacetyl-CoA epoxidase subunit PaaD